MEQRYRERETEREREETTMKTHDQVTICVRSILCYIRRYNRWLVSSFSDGCVYLVVRAADQMRVEVVHV